MSKYKDIEGAVPVDGNMTPISRKPVDQISGTEWQDMSLSSLLEQKGMLLSRMNVASSVCPQAIPALRRGISELDQIIANKSKNNESLI